MVKKTLMLTIWSFLDPFGLLWSVDKPAMFGHFWSKKYHLFCWTPKRAIGESRTFCQEMDVVQKTPKTVFLAAKNLHHLTLGGAGGKTVDNRKTFGVPLKILGF